MDLSDYLRIKKFFHEVDTKGKTAAQISRMLKNFK